MFALSENTLVLVELWSAVKFLLRIYFCVGPLCQPETPLVGWRCWLNSDWHIAISFVRAPHSPQQIQSCLTKAAPHFLSFILISILVGQSTPLKTCCSEANLYLHQLLSRSGAKSISHTLRVPSIWFLDPPRPLDSVQIDVLSKEWMEVSCWWSEREALRCACRLWRDTGTGWQHSPASSLYSPWYATHGPVAPTFFVANYTVGFATVPKSLLTLWQ